MSSRCKFRRVCKCLVNQKPICSSEAWGQTGEGVTWPQSNWKFPQMFTCWPKDNSRGISTSSQTTTTKEKEVLTFFKGPMRSLVIQLNTIWSRFWRWARCGQILFEVLLFDCNKCLDFPKDRKTAYLSCYIIKCSQMLSQFEGSSEGSLHFASFIWLFLKDAFKCIECLRPSITHKPLRTFQFIKKKWWKTSQPWACLSSF